MLDEYDLVGKEERRLADVMIGYLDPADHVPSAAEMAEAAAASNNNDDSIFFSAAKILRLIYNCDLENKIDQDIWNLVKKGVQEEPTKIVADFDTFSYSTQKINPADDLLHIFNDT